MTGSEVKITVYDSKAVSKRARKPFDKTALISVRGPDEKRAYLHNKPDRLLYLCFDDMFPEEAELSESGSLLFRRRWLCTQQNSSTVYGTVLMRSSASVNVGYPGARR